MHTWIFRERASAWTHFVGFLLSLLGTVILWRRSGGDPGKRTSLLVYGLCLISCYGAIQEQVPS
jgi:predicted membrane channel-forming protein YqfA (hemolysin III family)